MLSPPDTKIFAMRGARGTLRAATSGPYVAGATDFPKSAAHGPKLRGPEEGVVGPPPASHSPTADREIGSTLSLPLRSLLLRHDVLRRTLTAPSKYIPRYSVSPAHQPRPCSWYHWSRLSSLTDSSLVQPQGLLCSDLGASVVIRPRWVQIK